ncbi:MAG: hypothetical protein J6R04_01475 [Clostridia bacterium]|nr:hypothetical protein [Clostridia bacterium]
MTISVAPLCFSGVDESTAYIAECEASFRHRVIDVAEQLHSIPGLQLIGLSGPTCAGKTTTANILDGRLEALGRRVHTVSVDDFFREQPANQAKKKTREGGSIDFDSIDALDFDLFAACLSELMQSGHTVLPIYDLSCGKRVGSRELVAEHGNDVFLVEGIQVVYPEISALLHQYNYRSIYCDVGNPLRAGDAVFAPEEIRLMRRLVRDYHFRDADAAFTFYLWESVRANELKSILPNVVSCDIHLNTLMPYELGMLRPFLETILGELPTDSVYWARGQEILTKLPALTPLSSAQLPSEALYREFVPVQK